MPEHIGGADARQGGGIAIMDSSSERICMGCWATLGESAGQCPRCGRDLDVEDPSSYYTGKLTAACLLIVTWNTVP